MVCIDELGLSRVQGVGFGASRLVGNDSVSAGA